jgi:hypothetical protein
VSIYIAQHTIHEINCNHVGCTSFFQAPQEVDQISEVGTRKAARRAGWDVPPPYGKGSRRGTDFCTEHAGGGS